MNARILDTVIAVKVGEQIWVPMVQLQNQENSCCQTENDIFRSGRGVSDFQKYCKMCNKKSG